MAGIDTTDLLLEGAHRGDEEALTLLHDRFAGRLQHFVARRLSRRAAAYVDPEDLVQEVMTEVLTRIGDFRPRGKGTFYRLLATIARRRLIDLDRKLAVRPEGLPASATPSGSGREIDLGAARGAGPVTRLLGEEERELCRRAYHTLGESDRRIIWLRLVEERGAREIADLTGKSIGAVWVWFHRAIQNWNEKFERLRRR